MKGIVEAGSRLVLQTIENPDYEAYLMNTMARVFGPNWPELADISVLNLLPYGRASNLPVSQTLQEAWEFPRCGLLGNPVFRYDGQLSACCHEPVITGYGPSGLRQRCETVDELIAAYYAFKADPVLTMMNYAGLDTLTTLPDFSFLRYKRYANLCDACHDVQQVRRTPSRLLSISAQLTQTNVQ